MAADPQGSFGFGPGHADMGGDKGGAGPEAAANLAQGVEALVARHEMQRQQAGGGIEGAIGGDVDIALMKRNAVEMSRGGFPGQSQHGGGWVDAIEGPAGMGIGEGPELKAATGAQHQDPAM
jgi:hypothetical protein